VDGGRTSSITFATGVGVDPVIGSNYKLTLRSGKDTVSVGGLSATGVSLFLITNQTAKFNIDPFSGIQGKIDIQPVVISTAPDIRYFCIGMGATAQGIFAALINNGLPCRILQSRSKYVKDLIFRHSVIQLVFDPASGWQR
jgi:hypothetical protein